MIALQLNVLFPPQTLLAVTIKVVPQITMGRGFIAGLLASAGRSSYLACVQRHQTQGSQHKHNSPPKYPLSWTVCRISGNVTLVLF